jgi:hypothetical protein
MVHMGEIHVLPSLVSKQISYLKHGPFFFFLKEDKINKNKKMKTNTEA